MSYTGDVSVGGPPDTRDLPGLTVTKLAVGPMDNNAYLLRCTATGELLLIDAANEASRLIELLGGTKLTRIVTTHRHFDHWQALPEVQQATGATVAAHPADARELPVAVTELLNGGVTVTVGDAVLGVIHLRGHTPGSIALAMTVAARSRRHRTCSRVTACSLAVRATPPETPSGSTSSWMTLRNGCSARCLMAPGCTPATVRTPPSARSART